MKNQNRKTPLASSILLLTVGAVFAAIGIAMVVIVLDGLIKYEGSNVGAGIIMPIIFILALFGFGITALVMGGKRIFSRIKQSVTYRRGKESRAKIIDYKSVSFAKGGNKRFRYALILAFRDNNEDKTFTTDYLFDVNEYRYLQKLDSISVKVNGNFLTVCEPFPKDIYQVDSTYGIEISFFKQKPVAILLGLWTVFFFAALLFLIVSFIIGNSAVTMAAIITLFSVHFPFAIPLAIYLVKWFGRKK